MTREEAIESLRGILTEAVEFKNSVCYVTEEDREPLEMAIKALEHPERNVVAIVPCGDAISRQAVLDKKELIELEDGQSFYCISPEDVETLPPVNPQPKTGHWEWVQHDYNPKIGNWHCSECRSVVVECVSKEEKGGIPLYKYCPQCGAEMVEPQESEDKE